MKIIKLKKLHYHITNKNWSFLLIQILLFSDN